MSYSLQMLAVMQAIYEYRLLPPGAEDLLKEDGELPDHLPKPPDGWKPGDRRKMNESAVERRAQKLLPGGKTVTRQSWNGCQGINKGKKVVWYGLKLAMEGREPLPDHVEIEDQIASFGGEDVLFDINKRLRCELEEKKADIFRLKDERQKFEEDYINRAYTAQYIDEELLSELYDYKKNFEVTQLKLKNEEKLRQKLDIENRNLREAVRELKIMVENIGMPVRLDKKHKKIVNFSPKLTDLSNDNKNLMLEYYRLRDEAWDALITKAKDKEPDYIFLVFHNFNFDVETYIELKLKPTMPTAATNIVFACHQPNAGRRKSMFVEASKLCKIPPVAHLVLGAQPNVVGIRAENRNAREELYKQTNLDSQSSRPKIEPYNPVREGFRQVWINNVE